MLWLFSALGVVVVALGVVAAVLWAKVWRLQKQQKALEEQRQHEKAENEQKRIDYIHESLNVIARSMLDGQCPITEGCIRMAVLLDNIALDCDSKHRFSVVFEIYNATRHIPTHSSWKALSRKEQRRFEQEMMALEKQHEKTITDVMAFVRDNPFGKGVGSALH